MAPSLHRTIVLLLLCACRPVAAADVRALYDLFKSSPSAFAQSLEALEVGDPELRRAFIPYFDEKDPESELFAVKGSLKVKDKEALPFLHKLAHRRFAASSAQALPPGPERSRWLAQYEALSALAQWEGKETLPRLQQRVLQAPSVARIMAAYFWKDVLPQIRTWYASSSPGDKERARQALAAPVPCDILRTAKDAGSDAGFRRQLALKLEPCSLEVDRPRGERPAKTGAPGQPSKASTASIERAKPGEAGLEWVSLPGGTFTMGQGAEDSWPWAKPAHRVAIRPFQMAKSPVTNKQYKACVAAEACTPSHGSDGTCFSPGVDGEKWGPRKLAPVFLKDEHPVVCVDWRQASAFARWAGGRLPSEAQWEYAARSAGKDFAYPWGDEAATCARAVISEGGDGCGRKATWPVCSKPQGNTEQGLCDMAGNVWEWMADFYHDSYAGAPEDGRAWEEPAGSDRVVRGGSWGLDAWHARSVNRGDDPPDQLYSNHGLRPVRSQP